MASGFCGPSYRCVFCGRQLTPITTRMYRGEFFCLICYDDIMVDDGLLEAEAYNEAKLEGCSHGDARELADMVARGEL